MSAHAVGLDPLHMTCLAAGTVAAEARHRIVLRLSAWSLMHLSDDVQLVAAELVANACAITPDGPITVRFCREAGAVVLAVWDASDEMPRVQSVRELTLDDLDLCEANFDHNGGRGLQLVQALASECGVRKTAPTG